MEVSHLYIIGIISIATLKFSRRDLAIIVVSFVSSLSSSKSEFVCRSYGSFGLRASFYFAWAVFQLER